MIGSGTGGVLALESDQADCRDIGLLEYYDSIKALHIATVIASGALFAVRGLAIQLGFRQAMAAPLRYLSYAIDTVLFTAAITLVAVLHEVWLGAGWLWAKLILLPVYIFLGSFALKRGRTRAVRLVTYIAALCVFLSMYLIARGHDALAPLRLFD